MLLIIGTVLEVERRTIRPEGKPSFDVTDIKLLVGKSKVEAIRVGQDYAGALPSEGAEVALHVWPTAFATRAGASYRLTAQGDLTDRITVAKVGDKAA